MTEVRFHREIYTADAVTESLRVFARFGTFARMSDGDYDVVQVTAKTPARERHIVRELGNHVLGLSRRPEVSP